MTHCFCAAILPCGFFRGFALEFVRSAEYTVGISSDTETPDAAPAAFQSGKRAVRGVLTCLVGNSEGRLRFQLSK